MTWEAVGPVFIVDENDIEALRGFAKRIGCHLDAWPLIEGEDRMRGARLLGTHAQMTNAGALLYLGLSDLPPHIKPLSPW